MKKLFFLITLLVLMTSPVEAKRYGNIDVSAGKLELPNSATLPASANCNHADEAGKIYIDTDATTGQQVYVCEGTNGWIQQGGAGSGDVVTVNSTGADTTANFLDGDIDWTLADGGAGGPDDVTATVACTDCVTLTTETAGNYVASITNGTGITGGDGGSEAAALTIAASLGTAIDTTEITDGTILEVDLKAVDAAGDEECLTYETTTGDFEWQACGSGSSLFTDGNPDVYLTETTDQLNVGGTASNDSAKLSVTGDADQIQFSIIANATQTTDVVNIENSASTELMALDVSGNLNVNGYFSSTSSNLIFAEGTAAATNANEGSLFVKNDGQQTELYFVEESAGDEVQITNAGHVNAPYETKCIYFEDPVAADDFKSIWANKTGIGFQITEIWGESDQTVNFDLQIDDGTPADVNGTDLAPAAGEAEDTSLSGDTVLAAGEELDLIVTSVANTPTWVSICWTGYWN